MTDLGYTPGMIMRGKPEIGARPRVWLEISKERLKSNVRHIAEFVSPLQVMAVLKADAYGLGVEEIATILSTSNIACFGVAEVTSALKLKPLGLPIHILGGLVDEEIPTVVHEGFIAPITDVRVAQLISKEAVHRGKAAPCQLLIDTGMGRLGILADQAIEVIDEIRKLPALDILGLYSHFPHAYGDREFSVRQVNQAVKIINQLREGGLNLRLMHMANSDGMHNIPESLVAPFNMVRTGINLYGAFDPEGQKMFELDQVLELKTRLVAVRDLPKGFTIGYGKTFILPRPMRIGTISIGYADGMPMEISEKGAVLIHGKFCPVVGRVSMDFTTVVLDDLPEAKVGDEVVCLSDEIKVSDWADFAGTHAYEIICSFGSRVQRCYI